ncbi:MAG: riboflavin synthase [Pirellulaceae bacterium]|jgi:riboflavin synthase|nr:riboflavin synthase [Pirellulaceae bacterium]MDP6556883.1 riboflavin synthase [Pirellulaceae bacterium]
MFTGLVEGKGTVAGLVAQGAGMRLVIDIGNLVETSQIGDSVAVNGCCLTVVETDEQKLGFDTVPETLRCTNLGKLEVGSHVNIERSLRLGDQLGGHLVTGHIDAVGQLDERSDEDEWSFLWFRCPRRLTLQMASKGSVTIDGISLTLVDVEDDRFSVALIPHTLAVTTMGKLAVGDDVNLETDLLAKYVERQIQGFSTNRSEPSS